MRYLRSRSVLAIAASILVLGGARATFGLLTPLTPLPGQDATPAPHRAQAAPPRLAAPPPLRFAGLTAAGMSALAESARNAPRPPPGPVTPQYGTYQDLRRSVLASGANTHEFYFTRGIYSSYRGYGRRRGSWATDYPKADIQFLWGLKRLTNIDAYDYENALLLTDPDLRRYPFLYMLEVGAMQLTPPEVEGLRDYLAAGGFLFIDDFWGAYEWDNFQWEIHKVLPGAEIVELSLEHPLFSTFYDIEEILQVPNVGNARRGYDTSECAGCYPHVRAIFADDGRLLVLINWNTDLGDAWEWAEDPYYPLTYSNYAYQMAVNAIIYSMTH